MRSELEQLATSEENTDQKKFSQEIFFDSFRFFKRYSKLDMILKNLVANKISIATVNDDHRDFVFNLMKGYNVSSFFKKSATKDLDNRNLYEKSKRKALDTLLECEKIIERIKTILPKRFQKDVNENQKSVLLNAMMLVDIRNAIVTL